MGNYKSNRVGFNKDEPDYSIKITPPKSVYVNEGGGGKIFFYVALCWIIGIIVILLSSCATQSRCAGKFPCVVKDSVSVITKIVEKQVTLHDTSYIESFYPNPCADMCDSLGRLKKGFSVTVPNSKGTTTTLKEDKGKLVAESSLNGINATASVPQTTITNKVGYQVPCIKDHEHWHETMFKYIGMIATGLGALWVFRRVRMAT